jgi:nitrite reductase/ring-hydroxylating ferredoxin subunit
MPHIELALEDIPIEVPLRLEHDGLAIVVVRTRDGISAFLDRCPHAQWPISEGEVSEGVLQCPGHGWQFSLPAGRCLTSPAYRLQPLTVVLEAGRVRVEWDPSMFPSAMEAAEAE